MIGIHSKSLNNSLGEKVETFKPMMGNIVAGFILGLLSCGGAAIMFGFVIRAAFRKNWNIPLIAEDGLSWLLFAAFLFGATALFVMGLAFMHLSRSLIGLRVDIYANGIRVRPQYIMYEDIHWSEVSLIQETLSYKRPPILTFPASLLLPKVSSVSYIIFASNGKQYAFDGNSVKAIRRFGRILRERATIASVKWESLESNEL